MPFKVKDCRSQLRAISDSQDADIRVRQIVAFPQYSPVGEHRPVPLSHSRSFMNMPEQMKFRANQRHATPKDGISIVNLIRKVKDILGWLMGDKDVCVRRYIHKIISRTTTDCILEKHRHAVELYFINPDSGIAEIVAVLVKPLQARSPKAKVVIAGDEDLVAVRKIAEPFHKVQCLRLGPRHREVPRMHNHIALRQFRQLPMPIVSIRNVNYSHISCPNGCPQR